MLWALCFQRARARHASRAAVARARRAGCGARLRLRPAHRCGVRGVLPRRRRRARGRRPLQPAAGGCVSRLRRAGAAADGGDRAERSARCSGPGGDGAGNVLTAMSAFSHQLRPDTGAGRARDERRRGPGHYRGLPAGAPAGCFFRRTACLARCWRAPPCWRSAGPGPTRGPAVAAGGAGGAGPACSLIRACGAAAVNGLWHFSCAAATGGAGGHRARARGRPERPARRLLRQRCVACLHALCGPVRRACCPPASLLDIRLQPARGRRAGAVGGWEQDYWAGQLRAGARVNDWSRAGACRRRAIPVAVLSGCK